MPDQTKKCPACKEDIRRDANKCPHCQADLRGFFARHTVLSGCIILVFLFFIALPLLAVSSNNANKSKEEQSAKTTTPIVKERESTSTAVQPQPKSEEYLKVKITNLINEFDKNQLAAEDRYKGKLIEFVGYIGNISDGLLGSNPYLSINPTAEKYYFGTHITCSFEDKATLLSLENGQEVTLRGRVRDQSLGIIGVTQCSVVEK